MTSVIEKNALITPAYVRNCAYYVSLCTACIFLTFAFPRIEKKERKIKGQPTRKVVIKNAESEKNRVSCGVV